MAKALAHFSITRTGEDYLISLEDEDGETIEYNADFDMLDLITESIDEVLEEDDEVLGADEDEDEEAQPEE